MATNICVRGGFERFATPPGTSDHLSLNFWNDEDKYQCLDLDSIPPPPAPTAPSDHEASPEKKFQPMAICAGCRLEISDRFILKVDPNLDYHAHCLKCYECARPLDENLTAFVRNGQTYCRTDYMRLFSTRCGRCHIAFTKSDMVMRAGMCTFHMDCFCCVACDKRLRTGEEFQLKNGRLYCQADCDIGNLPETSGHNNNNNSFDDDSWETSTLTSLDHTSPPLSPKSDGMHTPLYMGGMGGGMHSSSGGSSNGSSGKKKKDKQTTRVRTVLNENQLKILKECYNNNSRPDAVLKEELSRRTGLNARVIRVWFQNKRCKDKKRNNMAQESRLHSEREEALQRVRMSGIGPLMVAAPTAHIDNQLGGPLEITQHYSQWAAMPPPPAPSSSHDPMMFGNPPDMSYPGNPVIAPSASGPAGSMGDAGMPTGGAVFPHYSPQHGGIVSAASCAE